MRPTLTQDFPTPAVYGPEPGESALRELYAHPEDAVRVGMIAAANGAATGADGSSRSLNGPADLRILLVLRSLADVVLVGAETARHESYGDIALPADLVESRTAAGAHAAPSLAIVTRSGELPPGLTLSTTWIVTTASSPAARLTGHWDGRVILAGERALDLSLAVRGLHERGMSRVLCEGGPQVADQCVRAGAADEWCLTTSPHPGAGTPVPPIQGELIHRLHGDDFRMERWSTRRR